MMLFHELVTPQATTTTPDTATKRNSKSIYVAIGVSIGVGVGAIILVLATFFVVKKLNNQVKNTKEIENGGEEKCGLVEDNIPLPTNTAAQQI